MDTPSPWPSSPLVGEGNNAWILHFLENVAGTDWMFTVPESYVDGPPFRLSEQPGRQQARGKNFFWAYATNNRKPERDRNQK